MNLMDKENKLIDKFLEENPQGIDVRSTSTLLTPATFRILKDFLKYLLKNVVELDEEYANRSMKRRIYSIIVPHLKEIRGDNKYSITVAYDDEQGIVFTDVPVDLVMSYLARIVSIKWLFNEEVYYHGCRLILDNSETVFSAICNKYDDDEILIGTIGTYPCTLKYTKYKFSKTSGMELEYDFSLAAPRLSREFISEVGTPTIEKKLEHFASISTCGSEHDTVVEYEMVDGVSNPVYDVVKIANLFIDYVFKVLPKPKDIDVVTGVFNLANNIIFRNLYDISSTVPMPIQKTIHTLAESESAMYICTKKIDEDVAKLTFIGYTSIIRDSYTPEDIKALFKIIYLKLKELNA